jgi:hypothetical protein
MSWSFIGSFPLIASETLPCRGSTPGTPSQVPISCAHRRLVEEHGNPFAGGLAIFRGAAAEFITTVEVPNEFGFAPAGDEFAAFAAEVVIEVTEFHHRFVHPD